MSSGALGEAYLGYLHELPLTVLAPQPSKALQLFGPLPQGAQFPSHQPHICLCGSTQSPHMLFSVCGIPSELFNEERKRVSKHCRWEAQKRKVKSGGLEEVATQPIVLFCETGMMLNELEVGKWRRGDKGMKPSGKQNLAFHVENVFWAISIVTDIYQVLNLRYLIGFSIFGSHPKGSDAEQLQSRPGYLFFGEIEIDESDHEKIGLSHQFVLLVHFHQPIEQHSSHVLTQLSLQPEVVPHLWTIFTQHEPFNLSSVQVLLCS